jgi:hypothetical protein
MMFSPVVTLLEPVDRSPYVLIIPYRCVVRFIPIIIMGEPGQIAVDKVRLARMKRGYTESVLKKGSDPLGSFTDLGIVFHDLASFKEGV